MTEVFNIEEKVIGYNRRNTAVDTNGRAEVRKG
jgi:hypothetical protein